VRTRGTKKRKSGRGGDVEDGTPLPERETEGSAVLVTSHHGETAAPLAELVALGQASGPRRVTVVRGTAATFNWHLSHWDGSLTISGIWNTGGGERGSNKKEGQRSEMETRAEVKQSKVLWVHSR